MSMKSFFNIPAVLLLGFGIGMASQLPARAEPLTPITTPQVALSGLPAVSTHAGLIETYYYWHRHYWHRHYWHRHYWHRHYWHRHYWHRWHYYRPYWRRHYWYHRHYHYWHRPYWHHHYYRRYWY
ncbi:MAG: hypothetical protein JOZ30_04535 [Hyphomicrobiales bacterium]|nr:hypothetical protein [Hyphomicrobiales bacterium]